jgi:hypothetical protein
MRTMNFDVGVEPVPLKQAAMMGIALLVHVLALIVLANFERAKFRTGQEQPGPRARFFVDVSLTALMPRTLPVHEWSPTPAQVAVGLVSPMEAARGDVEVLIMPRAVPDAVRAQLPARAANPVQAVPVSAASAASQTPAVPDVPAQSQVAAGLPAPASALPRGTRDDTPRVIGIDSIGSSAATYTFPALSGESGDAKPHVFRVEIGNYPNIEVAIVNHVIEQIRARYPDEITWESRSRGGAVRLSMRLKDHDELVKFLRAELFDPSKARLY